jgi:hypothetical protein
MSSGIYCAAITSIVIAKANAASMKSFETRHPDASQPKSAKPRQRIQIRR